MITVIDSGLGNVGSIVNMLKKIGTTAIATNNVAKIGEATKLILPGVGAFDKGMQSLQEQDILPVLEEKVLREKTPVLGICLGMQLMTRASEEGQLPGLGWIDATAKRFQFSEENHGLKIPHMGWNLIHCQQDIPLFSDFEISKEHRYYFIHSYAVQCVDPSNCYATSTHGIEFASIIGRDNIVGVQFHPEKSHKFGMQLLKNFVEQY